MSVAVKEVEVKERPIIFSSAMVNAILEGRKTQTRRVIKPQPLDSWMLHRNTDWSEYYRRTRFGLKKHLWIAHPTENKEIVCPYGEPGDRLWVREAWADADCMYQSHTNDVPGTVAYFADKSAIQYDSKIPRQVGVVDLASWNWDVLKRRPSIFMPRWASRITLEITNVRVERVQEISGADAKAEGVEPFMGKDATACRAAFQIGWDEINAKRGYSWASHPWCWVLAFKRL